MILRIKVESTGYISLDSKAYLEVTQSLIDGKGFYMTNRQYSAEDIHSKPTKLFTAWPVGYPLAIFAVAKSFGIEPFTASKITNFIFLALIFWLFRIINQKYAYSFALLFCSFALLEIFSYTWSDGPFLFTLLLLAIAIDKYWDESTNSHLALIFVSVLLMFLIRYVGFIGCIFIGLLSFYFFTKKDKTRAIQLGLITLAATLLIILYFLNNFYHTASPWGGKRVMPEIETVGHVISLLLKGLFNAPFLIRNYYFQKPFDWLFFILAIVQMLAFGYIYVRFLRNKINTVWHKTDRLTVILLLLGTLYLIVLIGLRTISPFEKFNYRLLAPFTFSCFASLLIYLSNPARRIDYKKIANALVIFFLFSLLMNLPKKYILERAAALLHVNKSIESKQAPD